ncbi:hypothetical protein HJFPF1_07183 [Paramyrothecium foliicola]|nr:hypothetical protein HJFPF1_07183 [Paramyrothecium foliicola]
MPDLGVIWMIAYPSPWFGCPPRLEGGNPFQDLDADMPDETEAVEADLFRSLLVILPFVGAQVPPIDTRVAECQRVYLLAEGIQMNINVQNNELATVNTVGIAVNNGDQAAFQQQRNLLLNFVNTGIQVRQMNQLIAPPGSLAFNGLTLVANAQLQELNQVNSLSGDPADKVNDLQIVESLKANFAQGITQNMAMAGCGSMNGQLPPGSVSPPMVPQPDAIPTPVAGQPLTITTAISGQPGAIQTPLPGTPTPGQDVIQTPAPEQPGPMQTPTSQQPATVLHQLPPAPQQDYQNNQINSEAKRQVLAQRLTILNLSRDSSKRSVQWFKA